MIALGNVLFIWVVTLGLVREAIERMRNLDSFEVKAGQTFSSAPSSLNQLIGGDHPIPPFC